MRRVNVHRWGRVGCVMAVFILMTAAGYTAQQTPANGYASPQFLALSEQVAGHLSDRDWRLVDVRAPKQYAAGHIPGAVNLPIAMLTQTMHGTPGMLAPLTVVTQALGEHGIRRDSRVVIYDNFGALAATRLFWILDYLGHRQVSVLQGGFDDWQGLGYPVNRNTPQLRPTAYLGTPDPEKLASMSWLATRLKDANTVLLDARSAAEFGGRVAGHSIERSGHLPGAVNVEWVDNLTTTPYRFKTAAELRQLYEQAGVKADKEIVVYCRTGMRASHTYFVLRLLGYPRVKLYDGSFVEWSADGTLPVER